MAPQACGTCRDRKVLCDRTRPTCLRCSQSGRRCTGYGVRLSWPRDDDTRRTLVGPAAANKAPSSTSRVELQLVNAFSRDIEMHDLISASDTNYGFIAAAQPGGTIFQVLKKRQVHLTQAAQPTPTAPGPWLASNLSRAEMDLFQYFIHRASTSLTAFGHDAPELRDVLIRMALHDDSPSATAVLKSALALASFHRDGSQPRAAQLKISALRTLAASTHGDISATESIRHVAAGMLLCNLEIQQSSTSSSHWLWYICGSKTIIKSAKLDESTRDRDLTVLIGWVQYHDVVTRFSLRHWSPKPTLDHEEMRDATFHPFEPPVCAKELPANLSGPFHEVLYLLSEVCDTVVPPSDPLYHTDNYREYLKVLEWKLRKVQVTGLDASTAVATAASVVELFQLAALVYLENASTDSPRESRKLVGWIGQGMARLRQLETCQWLFPVLILGSEAQTDQERIDILGLIARTQTQTPGRSLEPVRSIIQSIWVQGDLSDQELGYVQKLGIVFSSTSKVVPAFV
ncbi:hypothetical protein ACJZ2D_010345 [Fusarium nematophilum]